MSDTKTTKATYKNGVRRREQLILAASDVFANYGFAGGSLRMIAAEVGVSHAALARHFPTKDDLLIAVIAHWDELTASVIDYEAGFLGFIDGVKRTIYFNVEHPGFLSLFLTLATEAARVDHPAHQYIQARYQGVLEGFVSQITEGVNAGHLRQMSAAEIEAEARALIALMDGLELQWLQDRSFDLARVFNTAVNSLAESWLPTK